MEIGTFEVAPVEIGIAKIGTAEVSTFEIASVEISTMEVSITEISTVEVSFTEVYFDIWVILPPPVPHLHSLFEQVEIIRDQRMVNASWHLDLAARSACLDKIQDRER